MKKQIFTIPNLLSLIRLLLIPVIVWLYCVQKEYAWAAVVLVLSGVTDVVDGYIARNFNMVSDLGKALDPLADKLTQGVMLLCLTTRFPLLWVPLVVLVFKEVLNGALHLWVVKKTGVVYGANWHGKVTTCLLYAMMLLHLIWINIPSVVSVFSIVLCMAMMILSMVLYTNQNLRRLKL